MAYTHRVLTLMIAAAVALGPVGSAMAAPRALHVEHTDAVQTKAHDSNVGHHEHDALQAAASGSKGAPKQCDGTDPGDCCCGDHKANCAETCLYKCFAQVALTAPDRSAQTLVSDRFVVSAPERPPDWARAPQTPPPRA